MILLVFPVAAWALGRGSVGLCGPAEGQVVQSITANVADAIEITGPVDFDWSDLKVGANTSPPQTVRVRSTAPYGIKIHSVTRTKMAEFDLGAGDFVSGGRSLGEALQWVGPSGQATPISRSDAVVASGLAPTTDTPAVSQITFVQVVSYADRRLPAGKVYRIQVVYSAAQEV